MTPDHEPARDEQTPKQRRDNDEGTVNDGSEGSDQATQEAAFSGEPDVDTPAVDLPEVVGDGVVANFMPRVDYAKIFGLDYLKILPKLDLSAILGAQLPDILPKIDLSKVLGPQLPDILPKVDISQVLGPRMPDILPKLDLSHVIGVGIGDYWADSLQGAISDLLESLRRHLPPNWPDDVDFDVVQEILNDDGLPLVWVPRTEVVELLLRAESRAERVAILLDHSDDIVEDCREVLTAVSHTALTGQLPLATASLAAYSAGHREPAQALSVLVTETAVSHTFSESYRKIKKRVHVDFDEVAVPMTRLMGALAPIARFYTEWWPKDGTPAPAELSRHVSVHNADVSHYTDANALIALMLMTSVLRQLSDFYTEQDSTDMDS